MKMKLGFMLVVLATVFLAACGNGYSSAGQRTNSVVNTENRQQSPEDKKPISNGTVAQTRSETSNITEKRTNITLTIGDNVLTAYLNNTTAAQDLIARLPVKVKLADSDNDYCGGINPPLAYKQEEVQHGYKNGDLAFWTAGNDFVIFIHSEEKSANTGNLVIIGKVTSGLEKIHSLGSSIDVTIALAK